MTKKQQETKELNLIHKRNKGILRPADVVDFARDKKTALHNKFEWNNGKAADKYRLQQARQLITVYVEYINTGSETKEVQVYVSLTPDRKKTNGGYRKTIDILSNKVQKKQLLEDAYYELQTFVNKYGHLQELASTITAAIKDLQKRKKAS